MRPRMHLLSWWWEPAVWSGGLLRQYALRKTWTIHIISLITSAMKYLCPWFLRFLSPIHTSICTESEASVGMFPLLDAQGREQIIALFPFASWYHPMGVNGANIVRISSFCNLITISNTFVFLYPCQQSSTAQDHWSYVRVASCGHHSFVKISFSGWTRKAKRNPAPSFTVDVFIRDGARKRLIFLLQAFGSSLPSRASSIAPFSLLPPLAAASVKGNSCRIVNSRRRAASVLRLHCSGSLYVVDLGRSLTELYNGFVQRQHQWIAEK